MGKNDCFLDMLWEYGFVVKDVVGIFEGVYLSSLLVVGK